MLHDAESTCLRAVRCAPDRPATLAPRVERLAPGHEHDFRDLLLGLDHPSRARRFSCAVSDAFLIEYSRRAVATAEWIAGAFVEDRLRGAVEVYDHDGGYSEAAFIVEADWRQRGLGSALLAAATQWAACSERTVLRMVFSRSNWPMRKLASRAGARFDLVLDDISADIAVGDWIGAQAGRCEAGPGRR